jgi:hemoglobin/transferrin/lactoferrin receptor protein
MLGSIFMLDSSKGDFPAFYVVEEEARNYGVFTQARIAPTQQTRVSFGGRYDDHQLEGVEGTDSNSEGWSGNLSGEFDTTSFMALSAGYSHVFGGVQLA